MRNVILVCLVLSGCGSMSVVDGGAGGGTAATGGGTATGGGGGSAASCTGDGVCTGLMESPCSVVASADAGCTARFSPRCVANGNCAAQTTSSNCTMTGACRWSGSSCVAENCTAQADETSCLALRCGWVSVFASCEGARYDCATIAMSLSATNPAQACAQLGPLGLACQP